MSDVSDKITKILEDPESLKMISQIAESFMSDNKNENKTEHDISLIGSDKSISFPQSSFTPHPYGYSNPS